MKAVVKAAPRPGALEVRDVPAPTPGPDEVVLRVAAASVCGSDLHIVRWDPVAQWTTTPVVLGHEFAGVVVEVGDQVRQFRRGDAVAVESVIWCGTCVPCRNGRTNVCLNRQVFGIHVPGGMAEMVAAPERLVHQLPENLPPEKAVVVEPTTVAVHGLLLQPPKPGDVVLVTGPGPIGLLAGLAARAAGARAVVAGAPGDEAMRLPLARQIGLETLDPSLPLSEGLVASVGRPADLVVECSGAAAAIDGALNAVARGGAITLVGLPAGPLTVDLPTAIRSEVSIRSSYFGTWADFERAIALVANGTIRTEALLTPYPLEDGLQAFEDAEAQRVLKPVLLPNGGR